MQRITVLRIYLFALGLFTLFWWPLSHWFYPDWYHNLLGFTSYDYSLVKIIGTIGVVPVMGMFFAAKNPVRNRDFIISLLAFFIMMAATYVFLIHTHGFPRKEYVNVALLVVNACILGFLYPRKQSK